MRFNRDSENIKNQWGGELPNEEEFDAYEFFGNAGDAAEDDIRAEFGDDEFASFGSMEDPRMLRNLEEDITDKKLFKPQDADGNDVNRHSLVKLADGSEKKGRVMGFGDDGRGSLIVIVDWTWPIDMNRTNPEEMGKKNEIPGNLIVQTMKRESEQIEEMRGLGSGVKNSGDRNVKLRDDHQHVPLTNLDESISKKIQTLSENKITKKGLLDFIRQEAKNISKNI